MLITDSRGADIGRDDATSYRQRVALPPSYKLTSDGCVSDGYVRGPFLKPPVIVRFVNLDGSYESDESDYSDDCDDSDDLDC